VFESVRELGRTTFSYNELDGLQLAKEVLGPFSGGREPIQEATAEVASDHGGHLESALRRFREAVDACHEDVLDGVGHQDLVDRPGQDIAVSGQPYGLRFLQGLHDLLDEERVSFGLSDDQRRQLLGQVRGCEHRLGHPHARLAR